jgi:hypothetical protein
VSPESTGNRVGVNGKVCRSSNGRISGSLGVCASGCRGCVVFASLLCLKRIGAGRCARCAGARCACRWDPYGLPSRTSRSIGCCSRAVPCGCFIVLHPRPGRWLRVGELVGLVVVRRRRPGQRTWVLPTVCCPIVVTVPTLASVLGRWPGEPRRVQRWPSGRCGLGSKGPPAACKGCPSGRLSDAGSCARRGLRQSGVWEGVWGE